MNLERQNSHPTSIQDKVVAHTSSNTVYESEEDNEDATSAPKLRRGPARVAKLHMDYRDMISEESKKPVDFTFLGSVDPYDIYTFSFSSDSSLFTKDTYLS